MRDVLVTGATGFLGTALLRALHARGARAIALVRDEGAAARLRARHPNVTPRVADLSDAVSVREAIGEDLPGVVFHLAGGRAAGPTGRLRANFVANVSPTVELLEALDGARMDAFVIASTGEVYGNQPGPFDERMMPSPRTEYAASKAAAEAATWGSRAARHAFVIARLGIVYGPESGTGSAGNMLIPQLVAAAGAGRPFRMTSGRQTRDFLYVDDAARALLALGETAEARGRIINVGAGASHPVGAVATKLLSALGDPVALELGAVPHGPDEIMDYRLDTTLLRSLTGFEPAWSLEAGLRETARAR